MTTLRLNPLGAGQGTALERAAASVDDSNGWAGRANLMVAMVVTLESDGAIQSAVCVLGVAGDVPVRLSTVESELSGAGAMDPATRKALAAAISDAAGVRPAMEQVGNGAIQEVRRLCLRAYDRAVKMAQQTRNAPEAASCPS